LGKSAGTLPNLLGQPGRTSPALEQAAAAWRAALVDVASIDARSISAAASRNGTEAD
jgi:hypothetical protein